MRFRSTGALGAAVTMLERNALRAHTIHAKSQEHMTFSIVALDPDTAELGLAVQTCGPAVGAIVPWVEPGVGAVATQSFTNMALGPQGLALLRSGVPAPDALRRILARDPGRETRQVGLVDMSGRAAAHTGSRCVAQAGHVCVPGVSVQGNMLERPAVWLAMLDAYGRASGDLADRLLASLAAAEHEGGDVRGRQSAALTVASGSAAEPAWARRFDLRVDQAADPVGGLGQLLRVARAYEALGAALDAIEAGALEVALAGTSAAHQFAPHDPQVGFWHAMVLSATGRGAEAQPLLEDALRAEPRLALFAHRFADAGHAHPLDTVLRAVPRRLAPPPD